MLVCKQDSHTTLYEWLADFERRRKVSTVTRSRWDGKHRMVDTYQFMNELPLRNSDDAIGVNGCELKSVRDDGKVLYYNSFVTDYQLSENKVLEIIAAGRSRGKIENANNNTLKTKGYHFEHNFGHGKKKWSSVLATLILLAFLFHTVLEQFDECYQLLKIGTFESRNVFGGCSRVDSLYLLGKLAAYAGIHA